MEYRQGLLLGQLRGRRSRLVATIEQAPTNANLQSLLVDVDATIDRIKTGRYGFCETCNNPIEWDRLRVDPLLRYCGAHSPREELVKIFRDRDLATRLGGPFVEWEFFGRGTVLDRESAPVEIPSTIEVCINNAMICNNRCSGAEHLCPD